MSNWVSVKERLPDEPDEAVLVVVNGRYGNVEFRDAVQLGWYAADGGWIIEGYERWTEPQVTWWMELPDVPKEGE